MASQHGDCTFSPYSHSLRKVTHKKIGNDCCPSPAPSLDMGERVHSALARCQCGCLLFLAALKGRTASGWDKSHFSGGHPGMRVCVFCPSVRVFTLCEVKKGLLLLFIDQQRGTGEPLNTLCETTICSQVIDIKDGRSASFQDRKSVV